MKHRIKIEIEVDVWDDEADGEQEMVGAFIGRLTHAVEHDPDVEAYKLRRPVSGSLVRFDHSAGMY